MRQRRLLREEQQNDAGESQKNAFQVTAPSLSLVRQRPDFKPLERDPQENGLTGDAILFNRMKTLLIALIDGYRLLLSPFFGTQCRFYPTCSSYAREAIEVHGAWRGSWLAVKRVLKCHPWHPGGVDPVPPKNG